MKQEQLGIEFFIKIIKEINQLYKDFKLKNNYNYIDEHGYDRLQTPSL